MNGVELKPCPFCGSRNLSLNSLLFEDDDRYVKCDDCITFGPSATNEGTAIDRWNKRTEVQE